MIAPPTHAHPGNRLLRHSAATAILLLAICRLGLLPATAADGPPLLLIEPTNAVAREGEQVSFFVLADGTAPLAIQWEENGEPLDGATSLTLNIPTVSLSEDGALFSVVVTNALGVATSSNAVLTVTPGIVVSAAVNRSAETVLYRSWPMVLEAAVLHPDSFSSNAIPIFIAGTNGPWFNALQLEVRDALDQVQTWPFHPVPLTNDTLQLTAQSGGQMVWWLTPAETTTLPLGEFELTVTLNTTNVLRPDAWKGVLASVPVALSISNEPATLTPEQREQKSLLLADYALLVGERAQAQREISALLSDYPTNVGGLMYQAAFKQSSGSLDQALEIVDEALQQISLQSPDAPEPPTELLIKRSKLSQLVAPPVLQWSLAGGNISISWAGYRGFAYRLESSGDLRSWSIATTNFTVLGDRFSAEVPISGDRQFFRVAR